MGRYSLGKLSLSAILIVGFLNAFVACGSDVSEAEHSQRARYGVKNVLVSGVLPKIRVRLEEAFVYVGRIQFAIRDVARGERYIFVQAENRRIV